MKVMRSMQISRVLGARSRSGSRERTCARTWRMGRPSSPRTGNLLPLLEWIANSWDPLLHEERLPCLSNAADGWTGLRRNALPSPALDEPEEEAWEASWQQWWSRHAITAASEGGVFPDVVFRRFRDLVEVSWGQCRSVGVPEHVSFLAGGPAAVRLRPRDVAEPLFAVVSASADYLSRISPDSTRMRGLARAIRRVATRRVDGSSM